MTGRYIRSVGTYARTVHTWGQVHYFSLLYRHCYRPDVISRLLGRCSALVRRSFLQKKLSISTFPSYLLVFQNITYPAKMCTALQQGIRLIQFIIGILSDIGSINPLLYSNTIQLCKNVKTSTPCNVISLI